MNNSPLASRICPEKRGVRRNDAKAHRNSTDEGISGDLLYCVVIDYLRIKNGVAISHVIAINLLMGLVAKTNSLPKREIGLEY
jgi:hypothetical protein